MLLSRSTYDSGDPTIRIHRRSHISSFTICPARLVAEDKWDSGIDPVALERGRMFHRCAEVALQQQIDGADITDVDVQSVIDDCGSAIRDDVMRLFNLWQQRWSFESPVAVEQMCTSTILSPEESPDGLTHKIGGVMDLVCAPNQIWDWKTAYACMTQEAMADDIQVGAYALLASDHYGLENVTVNVAFVRWGVTRSLSFDLESICEWEQRLKTHLLEYLSWESQMLVDDSETTRPGPHCATCPILTRCDTPYPSVITNSDDASDTAMHIAKATTQTPAMKRSLIAWLQHNPGQTVTIGQRLYELGLTGSCKVEDAESLAAICKEHEIDFWKCLTVDKAKLETLCRHNPGLSDAVNDLIVDRRKVGLVPCQ